MDCDSGVLAKRALRALVMRDIVRRSSQDAANYDNDDASRSIEFLYIRTGATDM